MDLYTKNDQEYFFNFTFSVCKLGERERISNIGRILNKLINKSVKV